MLTRAAVATVLICIVILLTSACGLLIPDAPYRLADHFVLWQAGPGQSQHVIGFGEASIGRGLVGVNATLFPTPCRAKLRLGFGTRLQSGTQTSATLTPDRSSSLASDLPVTFLPVDRTSRRIAMPFQITFQDTQCPGQPVIHAEARQGPQFRRTWDIKLAPANREHPAMTLELNQAEPDSDNQTTLWGYISVYSSACFGMGDIVMHSPSPSLDIALYDGNRLTVTGLPANLNPASPAHLNLRIKFTGGPCDGQTFTTKP